MWKHTGTDLQVDDGAKLAEMLIEFADVVELRGNLPNKQLGVERERSSFVVALVVGIVKTRSGQETRGSLSIIHAWRDFLNPL